MAPRTINQRIALEGGQQIATQLQELARVGEQAFAQIKAAAEKLDANIPVDRLKAQLNDLANTGQQAFKRIGDEAKRVGQGVATVGNNARQSLQRIGSDAQQTSGFISGLGTAAKVAVVTVGSLFATIAALAVGITASAKKASDSTLEIAKAAEKAGLSLENFQRGSFILQRLGIEGAQASEILKLLGEKTAGAVDSAIKSLESIGQRFAPLPKALKDSTMSLEEFEMTGGRTSNRVQQLAQNLQQLANIQVNGKFLFDDATRAVLAFGIALDPLTGKVATTQAQLIQLAEKLASIKDPAKQAALATALLGEELGKKVVEALKVGSAEVVRQIDLYNQLRLGIDDVDKKIATQFNLSWQLLKDVIAANNREIGLLLAKPLTPFIEEFAKAIRRGSGALEIYKAALKSIQPVLDDILALVQGRRGEVKTSFVESTIKAVQNLGVVVKQVFDGVLKPALGTLEQAFISVSEAFNNTFGTNISPTVLAIGASVLYVVGAFKALGIAIFAAFASTENGLNPVQQALAKLGVDVDAVKGQIIAAWEQVKETFSDVSWGEFIKEVLTSIPGLIIGAVVAFVAVRRAAAALAPVLSRITGTRIGADSALGIILAGHLTGAFQTLQNVVIIAGAALAIFLRTLESIVALLGPLAGLLVVLGLILAFPREAAALFGGLAAIINRVIRTLNEFTGFAIPEFVSGAGLMTTAIGTIVAAMVVIIARSARVRGAIAGIGAALTLLAAHPVVAVILSLAAAFLLLSGNAEGLRAVLRFFGVDLDQVNAKLQEIGDAIENFFVKAWKDAIAELRESIRGYLEILQSAIDKLKEFLGLRAKSNSLEGQLGIDDIGRGSPKRGEQPLGRQRFSVDGLPESENIEDRRGTSNQDLLKLQETATAVFEAIFEQFAELAQVINNFQGAFRDMVTVIGGPITQIGTIIGNLANDITNVMHGIEQLVAAVGATLTQMVSDLANQIQSMIQQIISALEAAVAQAQALAQAAAEAAAAAASASKGGEDEGGGFAVGGYTGNISPQKIAGVVHGGEHVQPADVVRRPGVLAFLETLRRTRDLAETIRKFSRGFLSGGFVNQMSDTLSSALVPGFAGGGQVPTLATASPDGGNGRDFGTVTIVIGNQRFRVQATESTAYSMQRAARRAQLLSGGTPPKWER